ncbi:MAG TPA: SCO family protein, partial [Burkholderiales bacterium]|nr:SCO family protein [Burkholderiales bacterium]
RLPTMRKMPSASVHLVSLALVAAVATTPAMGAAARAPSESPPPQLTGHFMLTTLDGAVVTDSTYRGKWLLVFFGYTFCPDVCPTVLSQIGSALDGLGALASNVQPLFITVDPARDTAAVLTEYLASFDRRIVGLRGAPAQLQAVAKAYHVYYRPRNLGNGDYVVDHSAFIHVVDPQGRVVKLLNGDSSGHKLTNELRSLLQ